MALFAAVCDESWPCDSSSHWGSNLRYEPTETEPIVHQQMGSMNPSRHARGPMRWRVWHWATLHSRAGKNEIMSLDSVCAAIFAFGADELMAVVGTENLFDKKCEIW